MKLTEKQLNDLYELGHDHEDILSALYWEGLKQGVIAGAVAVGVGCIGTAVLDWIIENRKTKKKKEESES